MIYNKAKRSDFMKRSIFHRGKRRNETRVRSNYDENSDGDGCGSEKVSV